MCVRTSLLVILVVTLVGGHRHAADASRSRGSDSETSGESSFEEGPRGEGVGVDNKVSNGGVNHLDTKNGNQELHIEKNDFIDVSWQKQHPELFRVKRKTATVALDVKDNTYRVWTQDYPTSVAVLPGVGAMHSAVYHAPVYSTAEPVMSGGAPVPLPSVAHADADSVGAPPYYYGWHSPSYSLPYAAVPWAAPYTGAGYLAPDTAAGYLPGAPVYSAGYPDYPGSYSALPDAGTGRDGSFYDGT
ncbi:hypothetical protein MTO96_048464 [Rhipicephalus appendiculatus]